MFENSKLNRYSNDIIGLAYENVILDNKSYIKTYLVVWDWGNNGIKFVSFRKINVKSNDDAAIILNNLEKNGYKKISIFIESSNQYILSLKKK